MDLVCFTPLFAWSWSGHGTLTAAGIALAVARLIALGKSYLLKRFDAIYAEDKDPWGDYTDPGRFEEMRKALQDENDSVPTDAAGTLYLFSGLPGRVQAADVHAGNAPGIGESLEHDSQVRHFMRSRPEVSSDAAYLASYKYIQDNAVLAWTSLKRAINPGSSWTDKVRDFLRGPQAVHDFDTGLFYLSLALHTLEDSYAPGHVRRREGSEIIEQVNIWDDANKNPDPSRDWPGHEALDNPDNPKSKTHFWSARFATRDLLFAVLANLDQEEHAFRTELDRVLSTRLAAVCVAQ